MNEKFYISTDGECPIDGKKVVRGNKCDTSVIHQFFIDELFGVESHIIDFYKQHTDQIRYGTYGVDVSKLSFIQRMLFFRKRKNNLSKTETKEQDIRKRVELIKKYSASIVDLCSKYKLNIDGSFKKGSKLEKIYYQLAFIDDTNTKNLFSSKLNGILRELAFYNQCIKDNVASLGIHEIYCERGSLIHSFSYDTLLNQTNKGDTLLEELLNIKINERKLENDKIIAFTEDETFTEKDLIEMKKNMSVFDEIDYLKKSNYLKDSDLNLLIIVENAYDLVASSQLKIKYIEDIINSLGNDPSFADLINSLNNLKQTENENLQRLSTKANEEYKKYDVNGSVQLAKETHAIDVTQGNLLFDIDVAKKDNDFDKKNTSEEKLRAAKSEKKDVVKRTIMAQYLRERAFKTAEGRLSFKEFVQRNASLYNLDENQIDDLINEEGKINVRKL